MDILMSMPIDHLHPSSKFTHRLNQGMIWALPGYPVTSLLIWIANFDANTWHLPSSVTPGLAECFAL